MSDSHYRALRDRLQSKERRPLDRTREAIAHAPPAPLSVTRAHEISALAVGLLVLKHVEETGRTRLHEQAIQDSLKRVTEHLNAAEMMRLEVEAYEIVDWLVGGNGGNQSANFVAQKTETGVRYDPSSSIPEIVREAVAQGFDLKIAYYSGKRMEMNSRVISPKAIAAEVYVRAWCHERKDERIFRMDRIRSAVPVGGSAIRNHYFERVLSEQKAEQQTLELEHLSFNFDDGGNHPHPAPPHADEPAADASLPWAEAMKSAPTPNSSALEAAVAATSNTEKLAASATAPHTTASGDTAAGDTATDDTVYSKPAPANDTTPTPDAQHAAQNKHSGTTSDAEKPEKPEKPENTTEMLERAPAPPLTLHATPTDKELHAMEFRRLRREQEEAERAAKADEEAAAGDDDDQLTFF